MARATRDEWARRVRGWRGSGQSAREYAAREGWSASTLYWWAWRLGREAWGPGFVEVRLAAPEEGRVEVVIGGAVVRVSGEFDEAVLRRVLGVLEGR